MPTEQITKDRSPAHPDRARSHWRCRRGHLTEVRLLLSGDYILRTSSWDMCDHCHEWPTDADETRMTLDIYGQWLRTGVLDADGYRHVAHAAITKYPHLRRERLAELAAMPSSGVLTPLSLDDGDRKLLLRAAIGLR